MSMQFQQFRMDCFELDGFFFLFFFQEKNQTDQ